MSGRRVGSTLRLLMALAVVAAIITQLANTISNGFSVVNFFSYFTIQSNIIGVVAITTAALAGPAARSSIWLSQLRGAATLYMGITGMIFSLLLSGADVQTPIPWVNSTLHYVFPLFIVIDWLVDRSVRPLAFRQGLIFLVYPVLYGAYSLIRGAIVDWYPYPFLNARDHGYGFVAVMMIFVAVVGLALAWLLCWTSRRDLGRPAISEPAAATGATSRNR
ncbi:MAG: Pr6Pr family membrane protein [Nakamurella sp.]